MAHIISFSQPGIFQVARIENTSPPTEVSTQRARNKRGSIKRVAMLILSQSKFQMSFHIREITRKFKVITTY